MKNFDLTGNALYSTFLLIIATGILCISWSCLKNDDIQHMMSEESIEQDTFTYLALGDSYTIGEGVEEAMRWPIQLSEQLKQNGKIATSVEIIARTGWTTGNLLSAIDQQKPNIKDLVSLLIGVNNQYQGLPFQRFQTEFDSLLNIAIDLAGNKNRVFVLSIPDYGVTPFGSGNREKIGRELDQYNAYLQQRCNSEAVAFVDITGISRELGSKEEALTSDRLHPSGLQYQRWVEKTLPVVLEMLDD